MANTLDKSKKYLSSIKSLKERTKARKAIKAMRIVINNIDKNPNREGLEDTPLRYVKFLHEFTSPKEFELSQFDGEQYGGMIVQNNIPFYSLCEHHLAPFFGTATIAYIPNGKIVGLSKLSRTLDKFARQFQNQERITFQVAEYLQEKLNAKGVIVILKAQHLCMAMRGVQKHDTWSITCEKVGMFNDEKVINEFNSLNK